jgi:hypothetical protein
MSYGSPGVPLIAPPNVGIPPVPFNQPTNLFRYGEQAIWSTYRLPVGAIANSSNRLFATPLGQTGQGFSSESVTIAETSIKEGGRIPAGVAFDCFGLSCQIYQVTAGGIGVLAVPQPIDNDEGITNLINIQNNGVLSWDFTQTTVDICPVHMAGAGGGAFGSVSTNAAAASTGNMNNGPGTVWMYRKHAIALPGNSTFSVLLRFGGRAAPIGATYDALVKISLLGYYKSVIEIG